MNYDQVGDLLPPEEPFDLKGNIALVVMIAIGLIAIATLIVTITWWMGAEEVIRPILENSPLTGAIATSPDEDGDPLIAVLVTAAIGAALVFAISRWRRRIGRRAVRGETNRFLIVPVSLLRTIVLLGTITLLPVVGAMAAAKDLEPDSATTVLDSTWQITMVALGVLGYTVMSTLFAWQRAIGELPPVEPAPDRSAR